MLGYPGNAKCPPDPTCGAIAATMNLFLRHDTVVLLVVDKATEGEEEVAYQASLKTMDHQGNLHHLFDPLEGTHMYAQGGATVRDAMEALEALCQRYLVDATVALS